MLTLLTAGMLLGLTVSCVDDFDPKGLAYEEGVSTVSMEVGFKTYTPALESRAAGNAIKDINELWVVIYYTNGDFFKKVKIDNSSEGVSNVVIEKDTSKPVHDEFNPYENEVSGHATFKMLLPNGGYRMYAVANYPLGDVSDDEIDTSDKLKALRFEWENPSTTDGVYSDNVSKNAQMFGGFINGDDESTYTDNQIVMVKDSSTKLHAWVRRATSKLTVAFNTASLKDGVWIYLKSITIKDIPRHCYLGKNNDVGSDEYRVANSDIPESQFLTQGETIYFGGAKPEHTGKAHHSLWPNISSGDSVYGLVSDLEKTQPVDRNINSRIAREHSNTARALYFYENMQPTGISGTESDKRQDVNGPDENGVSEPTYEEGRDTSSVAWKDARPWGTYVEIQGYYVCNNLETPGKGDITYRFMLGKDVTTNYEAERNHHYRLTLNFRGNANDVDFHIDYKEEARPGFHVQDTTYVSYLYNQSARTMIRATPRPGYELISVEALILNNEWRPFSEARNLDPTNMDLADDAVTASIYNVQAWSKQLNPAKTDYAYSKAYPQLSLEYTDYNGAKGKVDAQRNCEFGFLSLRKSTTVTKELNGMAKGEKNKAGFVNRMRALYYATQDDPDETCTGPACSRKYEDFPAGNTFGKEVEFGDERDEKYTVIRRDHPHSDTEDYIVQIPLFTRMKTIDSWAVYSGSNPFYRHLRFARVGFVATYKKKADNADASAPQTYQDYGETIVKQSQRIDNPRAIYRQYDRLEEFQVVLSHSKYTARQIMEGEQNNTISDKEQVFEPVVSRGEWSAEIEKDDYGIVSLYTHDQYVTGVGGTVKGKTGTQVRFTYKPLKGPATNKESYGAVIAVRYHGTNCVHKIVVKQGYAPVKLDVESNTHEYWSTFNVYDNASLCKSPLAEGSFFKRYETVAQPILPKHNAIYRVGMVPPSDYTFVGTAGTKGSYTWSDINSQTYTALGPAFTDMNLVDPITGQKLAFRLPNAEEIPNLGIYTDKSNPQPELQDQVQDLDQGFGICYADGARTTLLTADAYRFEDPDNTGARSPKGVRGVVVYSKKTGDNIFFSFGRNGHARRKSQTFGKTTRNQSAPGYGIMQYGSVDQLLYDGANDFRPLAYDLPAQSGGIYWLNNGTNGGSAGEFVKDVTPIAIDFNGGSSMGSYVMASDLLNNDKDSFKSDALPIRPIYPSDWMNY